jgi:signal transduction histidine kinase
MPEDSSPPRAISQLRVIEWLVQAKAKSYLNSPHLWIILGLLAVLGYFYYSVSMAFQDVYVLLSFYPLLYAAVAYRLRGVIGGGLIFLGILVFHALVFASDPVLLVRVFLWAASVLIISGLVATLLNYSEYHIEIVGDLAWLNGEVDRLQEQRSRLLTFLATAAHDLKAPLTAIQGYFQLMLEGYTGKITGQQKTYLERSISRITELMNLIGDLLDIPRIEQGELSTQMQKFSLSDEIRRCLEEMDGLARKKGLELKSAIPDDLSLAYGSAPLILQVISNLIHNAISYTNEGIITVKVRESSGDITVEVTDTGIGIKSNDLPRVFDDFYRASNVESEGTGLGLAIARRIVESHGGRIWVESPCPETGLGSKFSFTLPKESAIKG